MNKIKIPVDGDSSINADFFKVGNDLQPLVVFIHGFKGFKDWGGFPYLMNCLAKSGFSACSFNFTHNGVSDEDPSNFTKLELFAQNTFSRELNELGRVIDHFYNNAQNYNIDSSRIALIGHSRGGGIAILRTAADKRIKCLVVLSSVSTFDRYSDKMKEQWRKFGYIESENTRTKQLMRLNISLLDDIEKNDLDIIAAAGKISVPFLIVHGKEDLAVKYSEAKQLHENSDSELLLIENTGHTFGVVHPFEGTTAAFDTVIEKTISFLKNNLDVP